MTRPVGIVAFVVAAALVLASCAAGSPPVDAVVTDVRSIPEPSGAEADLAQPTPDVPASTTPPGPAPDPVRTCIDSAYAEWPTTTVPSRDPLTLAADDELPPIPVPGLAETHEATAQRHATPAEYLAADGGAVDPRVVEGMDAQGFGGAVDVEYRAGPDSYRVHVVRWGSADEARRTAREDIDEVCALVTRAQAIPLVPGVAWIQADGPAQAYMAIGEYAILVELCVCVEVDDRLVVVVEWATQVATFLTEPG